MSPEIRTQILISRVDNYMNVMRTTIFGLLGVAAAIHFGPGGYSAPLLVLAIAVTAYGILAGGTALDDMIALRDDMDDEMAATNYGKAVKERNIPMLKSISTALIALIGLAEVLTLLF